MLAGVPKNKNLFKRCNKILPIVFLNLKKHQLYPTLVLKEMRKKINPNSLALS